MSYLYSLLFLTIISVQAYSFTLEDVRGEGHACEESLEEFNTLVTCENTDKEVYNNLDESFAGIDIYLATAEVKRELITMAQSQVTLSLGLLQKLGVKDSHEKLSDRLKKLEESGIKATRSSQEIKPELLDKYFIASIRYFDLKRRKNDFSLSDTEKKQIKERLELLELRYPLIANHNFMRLKDFALPRLGDRKAFVQESRDDSRLLDNFLFNDSPERISEIGPLGLSGKSLTISAIRGFRLADKKTKKEIGDHLKDDLQKSLASQLSALSKLESFDTCDFLTLHSKSSQQAINSSAEPKRVFRKLCECRQERSPVNDSAIMGMGVASIGGVLLCMTPSGIGQVIGCPTAFIAGWGATGASTVNFVDSLGKYNDLNTQGNFVEALVKNDENQAELELIRAKELELAKDMSAQQLSGLIGFGVGHVGFSGLLKIYKKSKLALSLKNIDVNQRAQIEKIFGGLETQEQTKVFVALERLDDESRKVILNNPRILLNELKNGGRCDL